jgi:arsenite methyltransferase
MADVWSNWLLHLRHGDDPDYDRAIRARTERYADRVLDGSRLAGGMTLADIGAGEGLIGLRAIDRVGPTLRVRFIDVSEPLLRHAEALAIERGIREQCAFHHGAADELTMLESGSVDVITTRAVLAYVADKLAAVREFYRVLKPGGRVSIGEPILRDEALAVSALRDILERQPPGQSDPIQALVHRWKAAQFPDTLEAIQASPLTNYSERDLVVFFQACGFVDIHLELHIDVSPFVRTSWETFIRTSPHPWAPTLGEILAERFTEEERKILEEDVRRTLAAPQSMAIERIAYVTARKPLS